MSDYEALLGEHKQLQLLQDRLRVIAAEGARLLSEARARNLLAAELEGFGAAVSAHFGHEEQGGYFSEVRARRPELSTKIAGLKEQHQELVNRFAGLAGALRGGAVITDVVAGVSEALETLAQHECDEDALLQDGMLTDIGAHD